MASVTDIQVLTVVMATPDAKGGAVRAGLLLGDSLRRYTSADVAKMEGNNDNILFRELDLNGSVIQLPTVTVVSDLLSTISSHTNAFMWPRLSCCNDLDEYDIVHLHNSMPLWGMLRVAIACRFHSIPYCVTLHGVSKLPKWPQELEFSPIEKLIFSTVIEKPYDWILENAAHLFALSEKDRSTVQRRLDVNSTSVVPNGVSIPHFQDPISSGPDAHIDLDEDNIKSEIGVNENRQIILFVGDKRPSKGLGDLLDAYEMYEGDAALVLVGPSDTESLDRRITEMGSGVTDLGYVERDKLERLFAACDVFAFPTRSDVFPLVILEALSHGAPVITTRVGAIPEFIDEDVGRLVDREAPNQIVSAMNTLLEDKNKRQSMAEVGRQMIRDQFSWDAVAAETFDMYKQVLTD